MSTRYSHLTNGNRLVYNETVATISKYDVSSVTMCVHYQSVITYKQIRGGRELINKQIKGGTSGGGGY